MSKSIYERALDIVNEALEQPDNSVIFKHTGLNELKKALEQAQKQEKLLALYKELIILYKQFIFNIEIGDYKDKAKYYKSEICKIKQRIKELENE